MAKHLIIEITPRIRQQIQHLKNRLNELAIQEGTGDDDGKLFREAADLLHDLDLAAFETEGTVQF